MLWPHAARDREMPAHSKNAAPQGDPEYTLQCCGYKQGRTKVGDAQAHFDADGSLSVEKAIDVSTHTAMVPYFVVVVELYP